MLVLTGFTSELETQLTRARGWVDLGLVTSQYWVTHIEKTNSLSHLLFKKKKNHILKLGITENWNLRVTEKWFAFLADGNVMKAIHHHILNSKVVYQTSSCVENVLHSQNYHIEQIFHTPIYAEFSYLVFFIICVHVVCIRPCSPVLPQKEAWIHVGYMEAVLYRHGFKENR